MWWTLELALGRLRGSSRALQPQLRAARGQRDRSCPIGQSRKTSGGKLRLVQSHGGHLQAQPAQPARARAREPHVYLEDSWVLGVFETADELRFVVEAVLTEQHPEWHTPKPSEQYAYKLIALVFRRPREVVWVERMSGLPAMDASGELDYGNIDAFTWDGLVFDLSGDWGHVRVKGVTPVVVDAGDGQPDRVE